MDEIDTTNPVDGEALPETEVGSDGSGAAEPILDDDGNPTDALDDDGDGDEEGPDADEAEAEQLEIERDGKIAKIPAWLKPELMMQADYTRKTQELADARRALEAERTTAQHASDAEISAQANLSLIDGQIAHFNKVDWNAWHDSDPFEAQKAFAQFQLLKDARQQTEHYLGHVRQERTFRSSRISPSALKKAPPSWRGTSRTGLPRRQPSCSTSANGTTGSRKTISTGSTIPAWSRSCTQLSSGKSIRRGSAKRNGTLPLRPPGPPPRWEGLHRSPAWTTG